MLLETWLYSRSVGEEEPAAVRRLPPGPHGIPPELVGRNQRERLVAAMAEVCAERGYGESSVAEVARRAGVSTASFYRQFKDRRECMLSSFEELFGRLLGEVERVCEAEVEQSQKARAGISAAAALLAGRPAHGAAAHGGDRRCRDGGRATAARGDRAAGKALGRGARTRRRLSAAGPEP